MIRGAVLHIKLKACEWQAADERFTVKVNLIWFWHIDCIATNQMREKNKKKIQKINCLSISHGTALRWLAVRKALLATGQVKQEKNIADGEDWPEFKINQKFSESQIFALYKDLEGYRSLWDTPFVPSKNKQRKEKGLENMGYLSETTSSYCENYVATGN